LWSVETKLGALQSVVADEQVVLLTEGKSGDRDRCLRCLEADSGSERWQVPVHSDAEALLLLGREEAYVQDEPRSLACFGLDGRLRWRQHAGTLQGSPACTEAILLTVTQSPAALTARDRPTGRKLWHVAVGTEPVTGPAVARATIYFGTRTGVAAHRLTDGSLLWRSSEGRVETAFAVDHGCLVYVSTESELVVLEATDGRLRDRVPGALRQVPPLVSSGALLYASPSGLVRYDLTSGSTRSWLKTSRADAPLLMAESTVYLGAEAVQCVQGKTG